MNGSARHPGNAMCKIETRTPRAKRLAATEQADMARTRDFAKLRRKEQARETIYNLERDERLQREAILATLPILSTEEIRRRLSAIKASDKRDRLAGRFIGLNTVSRMTGYARDYLYKIINGDSIPTLNAQRKLSIVLREMELPNLYSND